MCRSLTSLKMPSFHKQESTTECELAPSGPDGNLTNQVWKLPSVKVYSTEWWNTSQNRSSLWKASLAFFRPRHLLCLEQCSPSATQSSLGTACVQGIYVVWNSFQMCSLLCRGQFGLKMPSFHTQKEPRIVSQGNQCLMAITESPHKESGRCLLSKYTLHSDGTLSLIRVCSVKLP